MGKLRGMGALPRDPAVIHVLGIVAIVVIAAVAYIPAVGAGYIWDDDVYVTKNPLITAPDGLSRIWFSLDSPSQYFPLVYTTFRIEHAVWGFNPVGFHVVNILLHIINALLVWFILRKLSIRGAWLAAALFAVHPVNVESVAWVTERKNVLSTLFYLSTVIAWIRFTDRKTVNMWRWYALSILFGALALFAKTTACTLPAALLIVSWLREDKINWKRRITEVVPFAAMGLAMGLVSVWWEQNHQGTTGAMFAFTPIQRILIASRAVWFYLWKLVLPVNLTFSYPRWKIDAADPVQYVWPVLCIVAVFVLWRWRKTIGKGPIAAAIFFVATLAPTLGFISLYTFRYSFVADHYQYVACIGPLALAAWALTGAWQARPARTGLTVVSVLLVVVLGGLTWQQCHIYKDEETLWRDTIAKNPSSSMAYTNLGLIFKNDGSYDEAVKAYDRVLELTPDDPEAYFNMAGVYFARGDTEQAYQWYMKSLDVDPDFAKSHANLATLLEMQGQVGDAIDHLQTAVSLSPRDALMRYNLGYMLAGQKRIQEAVEQFREALSLDPDMVTAHYQLAVNLIKLGEFDEALKHAEETVRLTPDYDEGHVATGIALVRLGKADEAIEQFKTALDLNPKNGMVHRYLAETCYAAGRYQEAWEQVSLCRQLKVDLDPRFLGLLARKMPEPK